MRVPPAYLVCATVVFCATLAAVVILSLAHADTAELDNVLGTILSILGGVTGFGSLLYSGSASRGTAEIRDRLDAAEPATPPGGREGQ